jgi:hypothetical protein
VRREGLNSLAEMLSEQAAGAADPDKAAKLVDAVRRLAEAG